MIKITPYYALPEKERAAVLKLYLEMVADVVPFLRCDVLDEPEGSSGIIDRPRNRTKEYLKTLDEYRDTHDRFRINPLMSKKERDAMLARILIDKYSVDLHNYLYAGISEDSCRINRDNLRSLLTLQMPHGELPEYLSKIRVDQTKKDLLLKHVFRYERFSQKASVLQLLLQLKVEICPYCNRQYITAVTEGKRHPRPQLDHFKNKSQYPFLALSINNLIPCCGVCNHIKRDDDCSILYPYEDEIGDLYRFSTSNPEGIITSLSSGAECAPSDFKVELLPGQGTESSELMTKAKTSIEQFALESLYQSHRGYITELYFQRYIHTDEYMEDVIDQFPDLFPQDKDAAKEQFKRKLALMDYRQEMWGKRPLSKLTHDIMKEIDLRMKKRPHNTILFFLSGNSRFSVYLFIHRAGPVNRMIANARSSLFKLSLSICQQSSF